MRSEHAPQAADATSGPLRVEISGCAGAFAYEHTDIPPDMTIGAWRAQRGHARRHRSWLPAIVNRDRSRHSAGGRHGRRHRRRAAVLPVPNPTP
jgi:hypothetical protein